MSGKAVELPLHCSPSQCPPWSHEHGHPNNAVVQRSPGGHVYVLDENKSFEPLKPEHGVVQDGKVHTFVSDGLVINLADIDVDYVPGDVPGYRPARTWPALTGHDLMSIFPASSSRIPTDAVNVVFREQVRDFLNRTPHASHRDIRHQPVPIDSPSVPREHARGADAEMSMNAAPQRAPLRRPDSNVVPPLPPLRQHEHSSQPYMPHEHAASTRLPARLHRPPLVSAPDDRPQGHTNMQAHGEPYTGSSNAWPVSPAHPLGTERPPVHAQPPPVHPASYTPLPAAYRTPTVSPSHTHSSQQTPPLTASSSASVARSPLSATRPKITLIQCNPQNTHPHNPPLTTTPLNFGRRDGGAPVRVEQPQPAGREHGDAPREQQQPRTHESAADRWYREQEQRRRGPDDPEAREGYIPRLRAPKKTCGREDCTIPYCRSVHHRKKPSTQQRRSHSAGANTSAVQWVVDLTGEDET